MTANVGYDTEGTAVIAAILNFEVGASTFVRSIEHGSREQFGVGEDVRNEDRASALRREGGNRDEVVDLSGYSRRLLLVYGTAEAVPFPRHFSIRSPCHTRTDCNLRQPVFVRVS